MSESKEYKDFRLATEMKPENKLQATIAGSIKRVKEGTLSDRQEVPDKKYRELLQRHNELTRQVKLLQERREKLPSDKADERLLTRDKERHQVHLELLKEGEIFGKNDADVYVDLLLLEGHTGSLDIDIPLIEHPRLNPTYAESYLKLMLENGEYYDSSVCLPDEVILLYGVETSPEVYGTNEYPAREYTHTAHDLGELDEGDRQNMEMFSSHFAERMKGLSQLLVDEPMVRGWATDYIDGHNETRLYGVAVRKKFLPMVVDKIRNQKALYWGGDEKVDGTRYIMDSSRGNWDWRNVETNQLCAPLDVPEIQALPDVLVGRGIWEDKGIREGRSNIRHVRVKEKEIALKEIERIRKIINA